MNILVIVFGIVGLFSILIILSDLSTWWRMSNYRFDGKGGIEVIDKKKEKRRSLYLKFISILIVLGLIFGFIKLVNAEDEKRFKVYCEKSIEKLNICTIEDKLTKDRVMVIRRFDHVSVTTLSKNPHFKEIR